MSGRLARLVDGAIEATIVPSFTRVGYRARARLFGWGGLPDLTGRTIVITGATSGLGRAAAEMLVRHGARVHALARDGAKAHQATAEIQGATGGEISFGIADLADMASIRSFASEARDRLGAVDALVHNAGALLADRVVTVDGLEFTVQTQVVAPFLLTTELLPALLAADRGRVITVSSGGMYSERLDLDRLQMGPDDYDGTAAYARAKRAQVALTGCWADRLRPVGVVAHAMHPGWALTPGVEASLPTFRKVVGPLLRSAEQGADTIVWLCGADEALASSGDFWLDRRRRSMHKVPWTRRDDEADEAERLWAWCVQASGVDPDEVLSSLA